MGLNSRHSKSRIGLRDVAKIAGVSTATVSRVVNNPDSVSKDLQTRVKMVIEKTGWIPNAAARALASKRTGAIGAIFPSLALGDFANAIDAMQDKLAERNYLLLLGRSDYKAKLEFDLIKKLTERGVDGLILVGSTRKEQNKDLLKKISVPHLSAFVYDEVSDNICVGPDNRKAMSEMVRYLISLGHRRFGLIAQTTENNDRALARLEGVHSELARNSIAIPPSAIVQGKWSIHEGRRLFKQLLSCDQRPTAVICGNPLLAVGAVLEAERSGIRVPEQMSIVGYDDIEIMSDLPTPITTVRVDSDKVGRVAADTIVDMVEGKQGIFGSRIPSEIIIRASSGPPPHS